LLLGNPAGAGCCRICKANPAGAGFHHEISHEIRLEPDVAGFVKQIRPEPDFTMKLVINKF